MNPFDWKMKWFCIVIETDIHSHTHGFIVEQPPLMNMRIICIFYFWKLAVNAFVCRFVCVYFIAMHLNVQRKKYEPHSFFVYSYKIARRRPGRWLHSILSMWYALSRSYYFDNCIANKNGYTQTAHRQIHNTTDGARVRGREASRFIPFLWFVGMP